MWDGWLGSRGGWAYEVVATSTQGRQGWSQDGRGDGVEYVQPPGLAGEGHGGVGGGCATRAPLSGKPLPPFPSGPLKPRPVSWPLAASWVIACMGHRHRSTCRVPFPESTWSSKDKGRSQCSAISPAQLQIRCCGNSTRGLTAASRVGTASGGPHLSGRTEHPCSRTGQRCGK